MCEEILFYQVETVQGEYTTSTGRDDAVGRIKTSEVPMETQCVGVQVSQTQKQIGLVRRHQVPHVGQVKVSNDIWQKE